jgi:26S proteasome non-ATPase regulatory subunit 10
MALATQLQEGKAVGSGSAVDLLLLELTELVGSISSSNDHLAVGYCSRLTECSQHLRTCKNAPVPAAAVQVQEQPAAQQPAPPAKEPEDVQVKSEKAKAAAVQSSEPIAPGGGGGRGGEEHEGGAVQPDEQGEEEGMEFGDAGEDEDGGEEELDLDSIEGWNECVNTSMATAAHHAAYYGYLRVLEVIAKYFDCSVADETGKSPLHYAALSNQLDCVVLLVQYNAAMVDMGDALGDTALHAAASSSEGSSVLEFLLSCECSPDIANYEGKTIAHVARTRRNLEIVAAAGGMLYCVDTLSRTPLYCAASDGNNECIEYLMQQTPAEYQMWPDEKDGNSPLHIAAINSNERAVDLICASLANIEDISVVNKKQYTAAHVAASAAVLTKLYENGADLWIPDAKNRFPLYIQCFYARADSVAFLLSTVASRKNAQELIETKDLNGDTVLHVASLCGHIKCVTLLLYFLENTPNSAGITPDGLAERAGHGRIQQIILHVVALKAQGADSMAIFGSSFEHISSCVVYYGSRWTKCYSAEYGSFYFHDRASGATTWEPPELYDVDPAEEKKADSARDALIRFYTLYNPDKLYDIDKIVEAYKGKYTELFIDLAGRYEVEDLSIFEGVYVDE